MIVKPFLSFFDALASSGACTGSQAAEAKRGLVDLSVGWRDARASLAAAATGTENAATVFGLYVDIHYETDRDATPYRTPDFYGDTL